MIKYSKDNPIFNPNPHVGNPRQNGWKTVNGWDYQDKKTSTLVINNERLRGRRYTWHVTHNINFVLTDAEHKALWEEATRMCRPLFTAFWLREPDTDNHCNYHLIVASEISKERLRECIAMAFRQVDHTSTIAPVYDYSRGHSTYGLAPYICKIGYHASKRLYFTSACTLNKHGTIGNFWHQSPGKLWADVIKTERAISATVDEAYNDLQSAAKYLHSLTGGCFSFRNWTAPLLFFQ